MTSDSAKLAGIIIRKDWSAPVIRNVGGFVQERHKSIANALQLHRSCTNPSMCDIIRPKSDQRSRKNPEVFSCL